MVTPHVWPEGSRFPGIAERPYDQALLAVVPWSTITPRRVRFAELWLTQDRLTIAAMLGLRSFSTDPNPRVVRFEGKLFLEDGHHRVIRAALRGRPAASMRVVDFDRTGVPTHAVVSPQSVTSEG